MRARRKTQKKKPEPKPPEKSKIKTKSEEFRNRISWNCSQFKNSGNFEGWSLIIFEDLEKLAKLYNVPLIIQEGFIQNIELHLKEFEENKKGYINTIPNLYNSIQSYNEEKPSKES